MLAKAMKSPATAWLITLIVIVLAILYAKGVFGNLMPAPEGKLDFPKQWEGNVKVAIIVTNDNGIFLVDQNGKQGKTCNACSPEKVKRWGHGCKDAPKTANICGKIKSLVPGQTITLQSGFGSECWVSWMQGGRLMGLPEGCIE